MATLEPILFGAETTVTVTFERDGSVIDLDTPSTLQIVWTPSEVGADDITINGSVVGDGSTGQATFALADSDYSALTAPVFLFGVATAVVSGTTHKEQVVLPILAADGPTESGLCTLAQLKQFLGVTDDSQDDLLTFCIQRATDEIERLAGRTKGGFFKGTFTEKFDGDDTDSYIVRNPPITSVTSISFVDQDGTLTTVDSTSYRPDLSAGIVRLEYSYRGAVRRVPVAAVGLEFGHSHYFLDGFQNHQIVYIGGYAADEIPPGLQAACMEMAADHYRTSQDLNDPRMLSETLGDYSYTRKSDADLAKRINDLVAPYMRATL